MSHIHFILFLLGYLTMHPFATKAAGIDSLFAHYFNHAQTFADAYPREKVHLHFDNTSYYAGDTIWFKAYVVTAENNQPSTISTPLYVELIDQMGYTTNKQIIKLENGEGYGQIPLQNTCCQDTTKCGHIPSGCLPLTKHNISHELSPSIAGSAIITKKTEA